MKILFLTDNFPPEGNAPASRTFEHCVEWVRKGAEVTVITCVPNFPKGKVFGGYRNKWKQEEVIEGIRVIRVWSYISPNRGFFRRILDYISFSFTAFIAALSIETDVIVATSPQLFTALTGSMASFFKRKPWVMEVRDLWPESIKAVGAMNDNIVFKLIDKLVLFLYRNADQVVVLTEAFAERVELCGVPPERIKIVTNGVNLNHYAGHLVRKNLKADLGLTDKFVVAYIGTHGMAHNLSFVLDCAANIKNPNIHFLFVGDGAMKTRLVNQMKDLKLTNTTMLDSVAKSDVIEYISACDVALVNLSKTETFTKVIPSKIFENAAMGRPILLGVSGEAKDLVEKYHAGLCFEPENMEDFTTQLSVLYENKDVYSDCVLGCGELAKDYNRQDLAMNMLICLNEVVEPTMVLEIRPGK